MGVIRSKLLPVFTSLAVVLVPCFLAAKGSEVMETANLSRYFYDSNHVRYELYKTNGAENYNWLFIPGGPGFDSSYFHSLLDILDLPGNVWLIDLPGNGSNIEEGISKNFDEWFEIFPSIIQKFENPILVGHSFGGMFPLLFPELENKLKGFVILNSAPSLWLEAAVEYSRQFDLPDLSEEVADFTQNPSQQTFEVVLDACMPYYFPEATLEQGRELLLQVPIQYLPAVWWLRKAIELNFSAKWIPQAVPTLIVGSKFDCICPFSLFEKDKRFERDNIKLVYVENAGHFPWVEQPQDIVNAFENLCYRLNIYDSVTAENRESDSSSSFAVIYRGYIKPGKEDEYVNCWKVIANYFVKERGALGSTLHKSFDGTWVAYSRWKNKESRDASWQEKGMIDSAFPASIQDAICGLRSCLESEKPFPEISMSVVQEILP